MEETIATFGAMTFGAAVGIPTLLVTAYLILSAGKTTKESIDVVTDESRSAVTRGMGCTDVVLGIVLIVGPLLVASSILVGAG